MRRTCSVMVAVLLQTAAGAMAQTSPNTPVPSAPAAGLNLDLGNEINIGVHDVSVGANSDPARFQRYRDLRTGAFLDRARFTKDTDRYQFSLSGDHIGYRDQRIAGAFNRFGKVKATFEWNQVPLFYSADTRSLYAAASPGVLRIDSGIRSALVGNTLPFAQAVTGAPGFDLRSRRGVADFNLVYSATRSLDLNLRVKNTLRDGAQPWGGSFGIGGAVATELPVPIDQRTTDVGTALEYSNGRVLGRVGYDGSFFRNNVSTLTWDNPVRVADTATSTSQGRMALWPNSNSNAVSATGSVALPARSRATAYVSIGEQSQNAALIPFTVNGAIAPIQLPRPTAEAKARVTAMSYALTSRPTDLLSFTARYRQYGWDNRSTPFEVEQVVNFDTSVATVEEGPRLVGYTRRSFDAEGSVFPVDHLTLRFGYGREGVDRTFRIVKETTENVVRTSADLTGIAWLTLRGVFERAERTGSPVDVDELIEMGDQPSLRLFDISDRNRNRFSAILTVSPIEQLSFNGSTSIGRETYPGTNFGLRDNDNTGYTVGFDVVPREQVSVGMQYGYEKYNALQASRTANPLPAGASLEDPTQQFNDPRRDWTNAAADLVRSFNASMDLLKLVPRTDVKVAYDLSRGRTTYTYGLAPNTVIAAPVQLAPLTNELQRGTMDVRYFLTRQLAVGVVYWYDKYAVSDYALGPEAVGRATNASTPSIMLLNYVYRPYTANTVWGRLTYFW